MSAQIYLAFYGELTELLNHSHDKGRVVYSLNRRASIKDIIESAGVPHTEISRITRGPGEITFGSIPEGGQHFQVFPFTPGMRTYTHPTILRPDHLTSITFLVDINVLKLARNLRMAGFDAMAVETVNLHDTARTAVYSRRILLTRNRDLLKIRTIVFGQLLRSEAHIEQLQEVIRRHNLKNSIRPFSRCISCNGILHLVDKDAIVHRLQPLTKKYYTKFRQCESCFRIYWKGSHHSEMENLLHRIR